MRFRSYSTVGVCAIEKLMLMLMLTGRPILRLHQDFDFYACSEDDLVHADDPWTD